MFGIDDAIAAGLKILDKFIADPAEKAKAEAELRNSLIMWDAAQTNINAREAEHPHLFVSGWRPFIGWVCGAAFAYHYLFQPIIVFFLKMPTPTFDMNTLVTVLMGLLGLGGLRTYEKLKGVNSK